MQDEKILQLYFDRNELAIRVTDETYGRYCTSIALHILSDLQDAGECVNDAYLGAWNSIPPKCPENLRTYLGKLTRNCSLNRWKHDKAKKRGGDTVQQALEELSDCIAANDTVEQLFDQTILANAISEFLKSQDQLRRVLFVRRYFYLDPIRELAKRYNLRENTVASHLHRMRRNLKTYLEGEGIVL